MHIIRRELVLLKPLQTLLPPRPMQPGHSIVDRPLIPPHAKIRVRQNQTDVEGLLGGLICRVQTTTGTIRQQPPDCNDRQQEFGGATHRITPVNEIVFWPPPQNAHIQTTTRDADDDAARCRSTHARGRTQPPPS